MKKTGIYSFIILASMIVSCIGFSSCEKDFEEINRNPFFPTQTDIGPLFNTVVSSLRLGWSEQFYLYNETLYGVTQQAALTAQSFQNINIGTEDIWSNYYTALGHIREIERRIAVMETASTEPESLNNIKAQLKILTAYKTFKVTDLFGDIPFFDAGKGYQDLEFARPKFDAQEDIYKFLLTELQWATDNINAIPNPTTDAGMPYESFDNFDTFLNNDFNNWSLFANSLILKHAVRMADKDPEFANPIIKTVLEEDNFIITGRDIVMSPAKQIWQRESSHWSFREHNNLRMGSTIWNLFSETDASNGSGIYDPRAYIFFEPNNLNEWIPFPQIPDANTPPAGGVPYGGQRDGNHTSKGQANIYSPFNYYLIRDQVDVPEIIMTAAEVHFIKAEAYLRGLGVAADLPTAQFEYDFGIAASINFWQGVKNGTGIWMNASPDLVNVYEYINHPKVSIYSTETPLEYIYRQRWIDAFRQPWEAYALLRRTGQTPREGALPEHYRFPYPPSEVTNNPENWAAQVAKMGSDSEQTRVWWNQ